MQVPLEEVVVDPWKTVSRHLRLYHQNFGQKQPGAEGGPPVPRIRGWDPTGVDAVTQRRSGTRIVVGAHRTHPAHKRPGELRLVHPCHDGSRQTVAEQDPVQSPAPATRLNVLLGKPQAQLDQPTVQKRMSSLNSALGSKPVDEFIGRRTP